MAGEWLSGQVELPFGTFTSVHRASGARAPLSGDHASDGEEGDDDEVLASALAAEGVEGTDAC